MHAWAKCPRPDCSRRRRPLDRVGSVTRVIAVATAWRPHAELRSGVGALRGRTPSSHEPPPFHGHACALDRGGPRRIGRRFRRSRCHGVPEFGRLFRPVTLRRHLSMALPLSLNRGGLCSRHHANRCDTDLIFVGDMWCASHFLVRSFHNHRRARDFSAPLTHQQPDLLIALLRSEVCLCNAQARLCYVRAK